MGFLDKAKKLAGQVKSKAEDAVADARSRGGQGSATTAAPGTPGTEGYGTPYVPGMLGRPGWREEGLADPAAVLPIGDRDRAGVPRSTKSQILEEPYGMGRRWVSDGRSAGLFYQLYPEHRSWEPPAGKVPFPDVRDAWLAELADGRSLVFMGADLDNPVVLETSGLDDHARAALARAAAEELKRL